MKKIFTLFLSLVLAVGMCVQATPIASGSCGTDLTWSLEDGTLTISGTGAMYDYDGFNNRAPWYNKRSQVRAIVINEGLTTIGSYAFEWCGEVRTVSLPQSLTRIKRVAFAQCQKLQAITFPSNLQYIADWVLQDCESLTSLTIPASLTYCGPQLTDECINLQTLVVEAGNTVYDSRNNCNAIIETATNTIINACRTTVIPQSVTKIGSFAFANQHLMTSVTIPNSIVSIADHAFICAGLTAINIPASVTSISTSAFNSCNMVETITVDPANPVYEVPAGSNAITLKGRHTLFHGCPSTIIPEDIDTIGEFAFYYQNTLTSMTIPASVRRIEAYAFYYDTNMEQMTCKAVVPPSIGALNTFNFIPNDIPVYVPAGSITAYQTDASWSYFTNFQPIPEPQEEITLSCVDTSGVCGDNLYWAINCAHDTLLLTGSGAMYDFPSTLSFTCQTPWRRFRPTITTIIFPEGITYIGDWAFYQFESLQEVVIPEGVTGLGYVALGLCEQLTSVTLPSTLQTMGAGIFSSDKTLPSITIPASVTSIGLRLTQGCDSLKTIIVEEGNTVYDCRGNCNAVIETATNRMIAGCHTTVIPNTVTILGGWCFSNQKSIYEIKIPNSVTHLEQHCLDYNNIICLNIPSSVIDIDGTAFTGCNMFSTIHVHPANPRYDSRDNCNAIIETATNKLIKGCGNTVIPDEVTIIGEGAFMSNANLSFIALPAQIESIERDAFTYLTGFLSMVCYAPVPPVIDTMSFNVKANGGVGYISPNMPIYVPAGSVEAYQSAPYWNKFQNFQPLTGKYVVKTMATHGTTGGYGVYDANQKATIRASAEPGFTFLQWSNGSTNRNIRNITLTQDTTFRALFVTPEAAQAARAVNGTAADEIIFRYNAIPNATFYELKVFKNGKLVKTVKLNEQGQIVGTEMAAPSRIVARTLDGEGNEIQISLSNMEMGQDYNFSLDSYDMADDLIDVQAGTFNVEQPEPQQQPELACVADSGMCGSNLYWAINCTYDTLLITGSGAMNDYSYSNPVPWNAHKTTITTVLLPQGLTHLGAWSLYQFEALQSIVIPEGVTSLGYVALAACRAMTSVSLPGTLQTIGGGMFSANERLQSLTIPASVTSIGSRLTEECNALTSLVVEEGNTVYDSRNNCNAVIETATDRLVAGCPVTVIPNTVEIIGEQAFSTLRNLTQIKLPTSVTTLEEYCYQYCSNVKVLNLPSSVTNIHGEAFTGCRFYEINVITGNPRYDSRDNCNAIIETATNTLVKGCENTVIPDGIVTIGEGAFMSNRNLKTISLPATVNSIEHNALIYCNNLQSLTCRATVPPAVGPQGFNYGATASININPAIPVYVPGPSLAAYQSAPGWSYFTNFVALDSYYSVKALANHGQVSGTGTYAANATVQLVAVAEDGFVFSQWSDGSTTSTKSFVVTQDTTMRAFFDKIEQEEQVIVAGQTTTTAEVPEITITFEPVEEALFYELKVYLNGRLVATARIDANGQLAGDIIWAAPSRIGLRTVDTDPSVYQVNLSNLEFGKDYTFTLDTYNEDEECISAQNGSFNVEQETPTADRAAEAVTADKAHKVIRDGRIYILLPNGTEYDACGQEMK